MKKNRVALIYENVVYRLYHNKKHLKFELT